NVEHLTPILNVSNMEESFAWFAKLGWRKLWDWGNPPTFGAVGCGKVEIFLCKDGQGSRSGPMPQHADDEDTGAVWVGWGVGSPDEVAAPHPLALQHDRTVPRPPTDEPWCVREFPLRHPDGHTFRISAGIQKQ